MASSTRLVILDRDGVINKAPASYVLRPEEWQPITGSAAAIAQLNRAGFTVCVATNQSCVGRGLVTGSEIDDIHRVMSEHIEQAGGRIDRVWYCPHRPDEACACRKPATGMLRQIGEYYGVPLAGVPVVGDAETDLRAAEKVAARPILVLTGKGRKTLAHVGEHTGIEVYQDLGVVAARLAAETET
jgi:D-glycero-D-manno-heptose 1,7-bisphosphate phosphatase